MINPWLLIPASDYEAHMTLPEVAQAQAIAEVFASALSEYAPASLAVFGCTTGNGFNHIDTLQTRRVVGVDINPEYLTILKNRFGAIIPGLQTIEADFTISDFRIEPVSMVFAGLVFEYVSICDALLCIERCMVPGAILVAILQLPFIDPQLEQRELWDHVCNLRAMCKGRDEGQIRPTLHPRYVGCDISSV